MRPGTFRHTRRRFAAAVLVTTAGLTGFTPAWSAAAAPGVRHPVRSSRARRRPDPHAVTMLGVTMVGGDTRRPSKTRVRPAAGSTVCENVSLMPSASNVGAIDAATVCLINAARRAAGLTPLVENTALGRAAVGHSADMVAANYFDHVGSDGRGIEQRVMAAGFKGSTTRLAENLAAATGSDATPAATVASWLASPAHRANILDPAYRQAGVGVIGGLPAIVGTTPGATYTADFA